MKRHSSSFRSGFTIVEILVVIVIIGILASITIVAYKGAQRRAYNAQITQGVSQYLKAVQSYKGLNGIYPKVTGETNPATKVSLTCLGRGYPGGTCGTVTGQVIREDPGFNAAIKDVLSSSSPIIGKNVITVGGESFYGAVYGIDVVDPGMHQSGRPYGRVINYALLGADEKCTVADSYKYRTTVTEPATTACEIYISDN